ncbi:MAG TPA: PqqD family protein [Opitutae bacterium]|nr:PqqD family protein [Opitutae bacterium]
MKLSRSEQLLSTKVAEDIFLLSLEKGAYFRMDPVGARIWELLETPCDRETIVQALLAEYEVDEATCRKETDGFLDRLQDASLLRREGDSE